jgi:hypothetical protein
MVDEKTDMLCIHFAGAYTFFACLSLRTNLRTNKQTQVCVGIHSRVRTKRESCT